MTDHFVRESLLQERVGNKVRCNVCERRCLLAPEALGWCRTRQNRAGTLVTLIYGAVSSLAVNPIEKKPFYHFHPGTLTLTIGSWSCNFGCPWCQNASISKVAPPAHGDYLSASDFVRLTLDRGCQGTSVSFNEPTLSLEWSLEVFPLARRNGLYNTFVTNGYMTPEALSLLIDAGLDAMNVDVKGGARAVRHYCKGVEVDRVWASAAMAKEKGLHVEITTLVIPGVDDSEEDLRAIAERIVRDLGPATPWHVTSYYPAYRFHAPPTPASTLERGWAIGKEAGLAFVYTGNIPGHRLGNTVCPACGEVVIRRLGLDVLYNGLREGRCPACEAVIPGVWNEP
jgi:pyruvate formate lyase activating enzyme